jgi:hypothetical protein
MPRFDAESFILKKMKPKMEPLAPNFPFKSSFDMDNESYVNRLILMTLRILVWKRESIFGL